MKPRAPDTRPADATLAAAEPACPECGGRLMRVRRRATDRLLSLMVPVHRYRCTGFGCQWEGVLRNRGCAATTDRPESLNATQPEIPPDPPPAFPPAPPPDPGLAAWRKAMGTEQLKK